MKNSGLGDKRWGRDLGGENRSFPARSLSRKRRYAGLRVIVLSREGGDLVFVSEYVTEYRFHSNFTTGRGFSNFKELFDDLKRLSARAELEQYKCELLQMLASRRCASASHRRRDFGP